MGINGDGLVAAVLNRPGSLGPAPGKRSRGELPLLALQHASAQDAATAIRSLEGLAYRSFNMVLADRQSVWFVRNDDAGDLAAWALEPGLHMVTAHDPDDTGSPRVARHLPRFRTANPPVPPDWTDWARLLADDDGPRNAALSVPPTDGFGTACASLVGLPAQGQPIWRFATGRAGHASFETVSLEPAHGRIGAVLGPTGGEGGGRLL